MSDLPPAVASWRDQIERLSEHASPCRYLTSTRWAAMRANALVFIDEHGAEAHRLGWTAQQLFGVHPEHGFLRVEYAGSLMVNESKVVGVERDRIVFDRFSGYRTKSGQTLGAAGLGVRGAWNGAVGLFYFGEFLAVLHTQRSLLREQRR